MDKIKMIDLTHKLRLRISSKNETFEAIVDSIGPENDDLGALYYVVAVVMIYGLSIVMMIASHIRKNKQDNQLRTYLKEMAVLRKKHRREKLVTKMVKMGSNIPRIGSKKEMKSSVAKEENKCDSLVPLLQKSNNGASNSDDACDSVFQMVLDDETSAPLEPAADKPLVKKASSCSNQPSRTLPPDHPSKYFRRCASASAVQVHVINEQTSL